jgi:hypothetical protein
VTVLCFLALTLDGIIGAWGFVEGRCDFKSVAGEETGYRNVPAEYSEYQSRLLYAAIGCQHMHLLRGNVTMYHLLSRLETILIRARLCRQSAKA